MPFSMKRIMRLVAVAGVVFASSLWGGALIATSPIGAAEASEDQVLQDIRPDLQEVLHALTYRIQGLDFDVSETLMFDEAIGPIGDPTGLSYKFLNLQSVALMKFEERANDSFEAVAVLRFEDAMGKRAFLSVATQYTARNGVIYVEEAVVEPFYSPRGDAIILLALSKNVPDIDALQEMPLEEAYLVMAENPVLPNELAAGNATSSPRLTVLAFDRVRSYGDTSLDILASNGEAPNIHGMSKINQEGWAYTLLDADFEIDEDINYNLFRVHSEARGGEATMLGQFVVGKSAANQQ